MFASAFRNSVLPAFIPASDLSATISGELPPVAALTIASVIDDARSGAIEPVIAATDVSTPDIVETSPDFADCTISTDDLNRSEALFRPVVNPPAS